VQYVQREEDTELKNLFYQEQEKIAQMEASLRSKVDAVVEMDMHGNMNISPGSKQADQAQDESGLKGSGTYVLRDGKLVPGKGATREQATFSNWYCSNADPEDIRRHRELMDRMHYRGPKWEGVGVPKSVIEETNPVYRKVKADPHPSEITDVKAGQKEWEHVVR